ncbi:hypothetical protein V6N12_050669 [Hibiscus sabdariffa]|uniref:Uncharacterized protein n=1 Tax=Hibiscus sabdariffa TaxID=183260 RepID=A0ABR2GDY2_9ROSI
MASYRTDTLVSSTSTLSQSYNDYFPLSAGYTDTPRVVPVRNANRTCTPTAVPIRLVQKLQRLVSEEHVPIRLRVYRYRMHHNNIYEGKKCLNSSKTSPTITNG